MFVPMAITITTRETFPKTEQSQRDVEWERDFRITGGAIHSFVEDDGTNWVLVSEWELTQDNNT